jgi:hypothetical protein
MLEIHDRAAELTSAPVKGEGAGVEKQQQIMSYKQYRSLVMLASQPGSLIDKNTSAGL